MIVHEANPVMLRFVQKSYQMPYILQMGHWAHNTETGENLLVWEDVSCVPYHLYEGEP